MTTWHKDESLEDALEFFLDCVPDEEFSPRGCATAIIVSVGSAQWVSAIETCVTAQTSRVGAS